MTKERNCEQCKHHSEKGCSSWDCEFEKRMTREEAITYLKVIWNRYKAEYEIERETLDTYNMAIKALSEPSIVRCKECIHNEKCCQNIIDDPDGVPTEITSCSHGERREP